MFSNYLRGLIGANQAPKKEEENVEERVTGKLKEYLELKSQYDSKRKEVLSRINREAGSIRKQKKQKRKAALPNQIGKKMYVNKPDDKGAEQPVRQVQNVERMAFESDASYINRIENV